MSRPEYIQVRFTLQEKERYTALARVEGLSLAEWVREKVNWVARIKQDQEDYKEMLIKAERKGEFIS